MKNTYALYCLILIISFASISNVYSGLQDPSISSSSDIDDANLGLPEINPVEALNVQNCGLDAESILSFITPACNPDDNPPLINIIPLLKEDLYKKTMGPVARRSLLDQPSLQTYLFGNICNWNLAVQPFYNVTPKVFLTNNSTSLKHYLNLSNKGLFRETEIILRQIEDITGEAENQINIPEILSLFRPIKLQQHRAGFMFDFSKTTNNWYIGWRIPLYYLVEHFHLTDKEINRIRNASFFVSSEPSFLDTGSEEEIESFVKRHLTTDTLGLGDSRLQTLLSPYESECLKLWLGLQFTFPTAKSFKSGIIGEEIDFCAPTPKLNIQKLVNLSLCAASEGEAATREANREISNSLQNFLVCALDRLSTILINTPLGNGKHIGIGPEIDFVYTFNDRWDTHGYGVVEFFTSHNERKFFLRVPTKKELNQCFRNADKSEKNLDLINTLAVDTLFPTPINVSVRPGFLIKLRQLFRYNTNHFNGSFGIDYWRQDREHFVNFTSPDNNIYAVSKALHHSASQLKLYGSLGYHEELPNKSLAWYSLVTGDVTIYNKGIGHNYTLGVQCGINF